MKVNPNYDIFPRMKKADLFFNVLRLPMDFLMLLAAGAVTYIFRTEILRTFRPVLFEFNLPFTRYLYLVIFVSILFIIAYAISGLYSMKIRMGIAEEFLKVLVSSSAAVMAIIVYIFLRQELFNSRFLVLGGWFFAVLFVFLGRMLVKYLQVLFVSKYDFGVHKIMVVGNDRAAANIIDEITQNPSSGYRIVKHLLNLEIKEIRCLVGNPGVDEVILANHDYPADKIADLIDFCNENHLIFKFVPNLSQTMTANYEVDVINGMPLIELKRTVLDGWGKVIKRVLDVFSGTLGLAVFSPLMGIVAFAVKWETEGPVFARLKRVGLDTIHLDPIYRILNVRGYHKKSVTYLLKNKACYTLEAKGECRNW